MKGNIRVAESGSAYFSDELRNDGYVGDVEVLGNATIVVLLKPGTTLEQTETGLRLLLRDIKLRKELRGDDDSTEKEEKD